MKLELLYLPTTDLTASLAYYRGLGFTEVWREGETTAAITLPGSEVQIMLDADPEAPVGPMFAVESVLAHHESLTEGTVTLQEPSEIPGGYVALYQEPGGTIYYVLDQSTEG